MAELNDKDLKNVNGGRTITPRDLDRPVESLIESNLTTCNNIDIELEPIDPNNHNFQ